MHVLAELFLSIRCSVLRIFGNGSGAFTFQIEWFYGGVGWDGQFDWYWDRCGIEIWMVKSPNCWLVHILQKLGITALEAGFLGFTIFRAFESSDICPPSMTKQSTDSWVCTSAGTALREVWKCYRNQGTICHFDPKMFAPLPLLSSFISQKRTINKHSWFDSLFKNIHGVGWMNIGHDTAQD